VGIGCQARKRIGEGCPPKRGEGGPHDEQR